MTGTVWTPAQNSLQQVSDVLNPSMSCSCPKTRTSFALRAAGVRGTLAHDAANGAAAGVASAARADAVLLVDAVAVAATSRMASADPARSHRRLCIDSLRFYAPGARPVRRRLLSSHAPIGASRYVVRRRRGSLVRRRENV